MSDANYASIHVTELERYILAVLSLEKEGWVYKNQRWELPETAQAVVEYPAAINVSVSGSTSAEQATLRAACMEKAAIKYVVSPVVEKAVNTTASALSQRAVETAEEATRQASAVTDVNKRLDALDALVKRAFEADKLTCDVLDHRTEHLKNVGDHHTLEIAKLTETVKSLSSKLEDVGTTIAKLVKQEKHNRDVINDNLDVDEKRHTEQQKLNNALSTRVSALEDVSLSAFGTGTKSKQTLEHEWMLVRAIEYLVKPEALNKRKN